ncbi:MAG: hypothetical protein ABI577_13610 [bacterium]
MDLFELFETDNDNPRRQRAPGEEPPRRKGVRGFFDRWMRAFQDDDDKDDRGSGERKSRRADSDFGWD